ncbi:hypothetical protein [Streptomyces ureilyticus]|uniref:Uncharacterized protein n=1 Tax=Streptomyces ureilyticus TaxID=1775131 RepID=A0ABX0DTQ5_9ACTN|nr:hypothetical protein [Streptomyces ureilyticus]NGO42541.1 hypothetical protein [Streptomyces ureilyticus]
MKRQAKLMPMVLIDHLATTIKSLHDKRLIATVHYYGYWPFSVNIAGSTRYDATSRKDMAKAFKLMQRRNAASHI